MYCCALMCLFLAVFDRLGNVLARLLGRLPEAKTACNTKRVANRLRKIILPKEKLVPLYVTPLFTMVPLHETVTKTAEFVAESGVNDRICNQNTIEKLLLLACKNVCTLAHNGYHIQRDGVALGSPLGPFLANIFMSQFDARITDCANGTIFERYDDDILMTNSPSKLNDVVTTCNKMHKNLKIRSEIKTDCRISFLNLRVVRKRDLSLSVSWNKKIAETNIILNYYPLAPAQYKNTLIRGAIHRLYQITSYQKNFDLARTRKAFEANQYPPTAYNPLKRDLLNRILGGSKVEQRKKESFGPTNTLYLQ